MPIRLLIEVKKTLYPQYVQQVLWRLRQIGQSELFGHGVGETLCRLIQQERFQ